MATTKSSSSKKKLVRNPNTPSLKSQGAGYSTTNRKGETTFYKSSKDAPGYNDTTQSRPDMSKGTPLSKFNSAGVAITPESLNKTSVLTTLSPTVLPDVGNLSSIGNSGLASMLSGLGVSQDTKGQFVTAPVGTAEQATQDSIKQQASILQQALGMQKAPESQADLYNSLSEKTARDRAQKEVNLYTGQLNAIQKESEAAQLSLEGQGRGQTAGFIGGEQARINREAFIKSAPIQAQASIAQGNLEFAQKQLDTMFQLKSADVAAKTNFWNSQVNSAMAFATSAQQSILTAKLADINTKSQKEQSNLSYLRQLSAEARDNGNNNALKALATIDTSSPTFEADVARAAQMIQKPVVATAPVKRDTAFDKDGNLVDMQTGEVIRSSQVVGNFPGGQEGVRQYEIQKADIQMGYNTAKDLLNNKTGLDLATGAFQSPAMKTLLTNVGGSIAGFGAAGTVVPGIGTALGAATGAVAGLATAPFAYSYNKTQQDNFLAGASFLINDSTFGEIRNLKAQGVTFGNMTEGERIAAGRAATNLASAAELDESGKVTGFRGDANKIKGYIQDIMTAYEGRQEYLDKQYAISPVDEDEAANVWGGNN